MPFDGGNKRMAFSIGFSRNPRDDFGVFSKGYRMAGNALAAELSRKPRFSCYEAYPVVFLYRHALELALKNIIYKAASLAVFQRLDAIDAKLYNTHDLTTLAKQSRQVLLTLFPQDPDLNRIADELLPLAKDFALIDPDSFAYRYPIDRNGQPAVSREQCVTLDDLGARVDEMIEHLDTIDFGMQIETDKARELCNIIEEMTS